MDKKIRTVVLFLVLYVVLFLVGFRSGEIYYRMKKGYVAEKVVVPSSDVFYVVEERDYGTYKYTDIYECGVGNALIKCLSNEKLKPLLKLKKVQIYNMGGDRVY